MYITGLRLFMYSKFSVFLKSFIVKLEEKGQGTWSVPPGNSSLLCHPTTPPPPLTIIIFTKKTLLLVIQTPNFPKGTRSLLPQKTFMVS